MSPGLQYSFYSMQEQIKRIPVAPSGFEHFRVDLGFIPSRNILDIHCIDSRPLHDVSKKCMETLCGVQYCGKLNCCVLMNRTH